jgi:hypothetical protein
MDLINGRDNATRDVNLWVIAAGALAGALAGYVLITPRGRHALENAIVTLDDFAASCVRFSQSVARAHGAASDGWSAVTGVITSKSFRSR